MNSKPYPAEKRLKISQQPVEEIVRFTKEVSPNLWNAFARRLPPVDGFRRGNPQELQKRIKTFINRIQRWNDMEWMLFKDLWVDWVKTHSQLDELLSILDNSADFIENNEGIPPNTPLDIQCFKFLALKSEESRVPRELIKRFYDFGYFQEDERIEQYIAVAKSKAELKLFELPSELDKVWVQLIDLKTALDREKSLGLVDSFAKVEKTLEETIKQIQEMRQNNHNLYQNFQQLQQDVEKLDHVYDSLESSMFKRFSDMIDQKYNLLQSDLIREINDRFDTAVDSLSQEVNDLRYEVEHKEREIAVCSAFEVQCQEKLDQVIIVDNLSVTTPLEELDTPNKFVNALCENFQNVGMQSFAARVLADEVLAAFAAGQIVSFRGSMASIVALLCARTLAGPSIRMVHIPIGLLDGREFGTSLYRVLDVSGCKTSVSALILEGINLSAPEVYARSLRQLISERFLGIESTGRNLILLGTVVDGPGALDIPPELCELGPIFHTDCIAWRDKWSRRSVTVGFVPSEVWDPWISIVDTPEDWEDLYADYSHLGGHPTVLWRRCLYTAAAKLNRMVTAGNVPTLIQSLVFGWLLPRGIASGVNLADYENLLAEGRVDASKADERIVKLLEFLKD